jgi:nucleoside-diphosphate-sugar epimerase
MRVFVAGAGGAVGRPLVSLLIERGHQVTATTRNRTTARELSGIGASVVALDGLDAAAVGEAVVRAEPDVIVHEMTALSASPDLRHFDSWFAMTNRLRTEGLDHLLAAARAAGVRRLVAQSYTGWNNRRDVDRPVTEADPFDSSPAPAQRESLAAIVRLERSVLDAPLDGVVLRYANLYGPGSSEGLVDLLRQRKMPVIGDGSGVWSWIHNADAAAATAIAVERDDRGIYNIADDEPSPVSEWLPYLAGVIGAKPPLHLPPLIGRLLAGEVVVGWMTKARGASNEKAKRELGWQPAWRTWRDGFRHGLEASAIPTDERATLAS